MVSIESEKRAVDTVAEQTGLMKHKILHQRKMMGGVNAAKENEYMVQKQVRINLRHTFTAQKQAGIQEKTHLVHHILVFFQLCSKHACYTMSATKVYLGT